MAKKQIKINLFPGKKGLLYPILGIILIIIAITASYKVMGEAPFFGNRANNSQPIEEKQFNAPQGWKITQQNDGQTLLRMEKEGEYVIRPTIVVISSTKDNQENEVYIQNLIKGARSTIPSLTYSPIKSSVTDNLFQANLAGHYYNTRQKINLHQRVAIYDNQKVVTFTASYTEKDLSIPEVEQIFSSYQQSL